MTINDFSKPQKPTNVHPTTSPRPLQGFARGNEEAPPKVRAVNVTSIAEGASRRMFWFRALLLVCVPLMQLASYPLWLNRRQYPLLPLTPGFPIATPPWDAVLWAILLASLVAAWWRYRPAVAVFLVGSIYMVLADQARLQPWFYMFWVLMLLTLAPDKSALSTCRLFICAVYVWSGVQKLNPDFFKLVVPWFVRPAEGRVPDWMLTSMQWGIAAAPAVEVLIGIGLWFERTRRVAIGVAVLVHVFALAFLGPWGHGHNWIVWPWNLVMPAMLLVLFPPHPGSELWSGLRQRLWAAAAVVLVSVLPAFSFFGWWDSYLSFSLYTGHLTKADLYISAAVKEKLPPAVLQFVVPTPEPYNRELQGPFVVLVELWSDKIARVPPLPEARNYRNIAAYLANLAQDPNDVRLVLIPRVGPTLFYRGSDLRPSAGIKL